MSNRLRLTNVVIIVVMLFIAFSGPAVRSVLAVSTNLVISQVFGGGGNSGAVYKNDFIELFNLGTAPVDLSGWSVQYTSATGTSWQVTNLTGTVQPGKYFLVQEAVGAGGTTSLPTPDVIGVIPMGGSAGKVALVNNTTALSGACPTGLVDLVGYGPTAYCSEGSPTAVLSSTTAAIRLVNGCYDTDNNSSDFAIDAPAPRNSSTPGITCSAPTNPAGVTLAAPASIIPGQNTLLTVAVTAGANPPSTGVTVKADLTALGGSAAQSFFDDGTHGDVAAADNTFSFQTTAVNGTAPAALSLPVTISDAQTRTATPTIALTLLPRIALTSPNVIHVLEGVAATFTVKAKDATGIAVDAVITAGAPAGIILQEVLPAAASGAELSAILAIANTTAPGSYNIQITFTNNDPAPQTTPQIVQVIVAPVACSDPDPSYPLTGISAVQGSGMTSPLSGSKLSVRGQVTGAFISSAKLNGFFVQDAGDGDPATSDGVFVNTSASAFSALTLYAGDWVQVSAAVNETSGLTVLTPAAAKDIALCGNAPVISPTALSLPVPAALGGVNYLERYEGMLITVPQVLTVTETYNLARYNQILASVDGRLYNTTNDPGQTRAVANSLSSITIDDGRIAQNPNPLLFLQGTGPDRTLRIGSTTTGATGNLNTLNNTYMLEPTAALTFDTSPNPRPAAPAAIVSDIKVAGFNVYNYFTTLNATPYPADSPYGGSNTPRGAYTAAELTRQTTKLVEVIRGTGADVIGVFEVEKWAGANAAQTLVEAVNAGMSVDSPDRYAVAPDPDNGFGGDFIKQAIFYKPAKLTLVPGGNLSANDPIFDRFPVAQEFEAANHEKFFVVMNHLKSKSSCPADANDPNAEHGQGCWNVKRVSQAAALLTFINTVLKPLDPDVLVMGDMNAYGLEDPIVAFTNGGLVNQIARWVTNPLDRYSYVFNGEAGYLDHSLASPSMNLQAKGATIWHVNADEPSAIDYSMRFKTDDPYAPVLYRASDHDPIITGLTLFPNQAPLLENAIPAQDASWGRLWTFVFAGNTFSDPDAAQGDTLSYSATLADGSALPAWLTFTGSTRTFSGTPPVASVGALSFKVTATDLSGANVSTTFALNVSNHAPTVGQPIAKQKAYRGADFIYSVPSNAFADLDLLYGDALTLSATLEDGSPLPAWLKFAPEVNTFRGTPASLLDLGQLKVKLTATDKANASISQVFDLTVYTTYLLPFISQ